MVSIVIRKKEADPRRAFGQAVRRLRESKGSRNIALVNMTRIAEALV